jgi:hypothetical protein
VQKIIEKKAYYLQKLTTSAKTNTNTIEVKA